MTSDLSAFGFAPGGYWCNCRDCLTQFVGEKRAWRCKPCAEKAASEPTHPASHDAGEAVAYVLEDGRIRPHLGIDPKPGADLFEWPADTIDTLIAEVSRVTAELAEARALKQELESDYQRVCRRLAAMTEQRDSLRDECEGLREALASLIGATRHLNPCPGTMEQALAALSASGREVNDAPAE